MARALRIVGTTYAAQGVALGNEVSVKYGRQHLLKGLKTAKACAFLGIMPSLYLELAKTFMGEERQKCLSNARRLAIRFGLKPKLREIERAISDYGDSTHQDDHRQR